MLGWLIYMGDLPFSKEKEGEVDGGNLVGGTGRRGGRENVIWLRK